MMMLETVAPTEIKREPYENTKRFVLILAKRRWWIAAITLLSVVVAAVLAFTTTPVFEAKTTLVPVEEGAGAGLMGGALGQFGGLAALAGLQGTKNRTEVEAIALLKSRQFTEDFIRDRNLLPVLFPKLWDKSSNRWKAGVKIPDLWDGYRLFNRRIRFVDQDEKTGVVTLRIDWHDPAEAASWANDLVRRVNAEMQKRALVESNTTLEYLKEELKNTQVASVQNALQDLIEENLKQEAVAHVRSDYVFRVVDPAAPPDPKDKIRPHKAIYLITGFFFGALLSMLVVLGLEAIRNIRFWLKADSSAW